MKRLHLDIETYSPEPIEDAGNYKYALHPDFRILLCAYAHDDGPVRCIDVESEGGLPKWLESELMDASVVKVAHNAIFERVCFTMYLRSSGALKITEWLDAGQWDCTMVKAIRCGLPASLSQVGEVLGFDKQKMKEGKGLINIFCVPRTVDQTGLFKGAGRVMPSDRPEDWESFKSYCVRDVEVEREIDKALAWYQSPEWEIAMYEVDQRVNDRGVRVDLTLASAAKRMDMMIKARLNKEAIDITGLSNPNSVEQLKSWIGLRTGAEIAKLRKTDVADLTASIDDPDIRRLLQIRVEMGKTSCAKYYSMLNASAPDGRVRGLTQFCGTRTGRWAGRLVQMQNLPQNKLPFSELSFARKCLRAGDYSTLELVFGNVPDAMSQLIRTAFIPKDGCVFAMCDFSAIEARVLAWLAGEDWVLDTFRAGGDIYCAAASRMFKVPVEKHGRNAELRQKGKIAVLALGYGGGVGALDQMGGKRMGLTEQEEREIVDMWRESNPHIVAYWRGIETAAKRAALFGARTNYGRIEFFRAEGGTLVAVLPSGRWICWNRMTEGHNKFGKTSLRFKGLDQQTKKWGWIETWGGKLTENITQAVARDCLAHTMKLTEDAGIPIVFHVHDELICEVPDKSWLDRLVSIFSITPEWADGLPLKGAGYTGDYYFKD